MTLDVPTCSYVLEAGTDPATFLSALDEQSGGAVEVAAPGAWSTWTVLDTADRRLRAAGVEADLVERPDGPWLTLGDGGPRRGPSLRVDPAHRWLVDELSPGVVRARLAPLVSMRALLPVVTLARRDHPFVVRNADEKVVVRGRVGEARAVPVGDGFAPVDLRPRVELTGVLGYPKPFDRLRSVLDDELGLKRARRPLADEAALAAGQSLAGVPSKPDVDLSPTQRTDTAAFAILRSLADIVEANVPGTLADLDTEFLHDLRVAIRRSRSVLRELKRAWADGPRDAQADTLRWVQAITGPVRDLDVQLLEWDDLVAPLPEARRHDLAPVRALLVEHRAAAFADLTAALRGDHYATAWAGWRAFLDNDLPSGPQHGGPRRNRPHAGPDAALPIHDVAAGRVARVYRRMQKMGGAIDDSSPAQDLHDLRKRGKELRYLLELFGGVLVGGAVRPMVTALKGLQDVLGRHQDCEVQAGELRALAPELARSGGDDVPAALLALGALIDRLEADQARARQGFAARFAAFRSLEVPA